MPDPVPRAAAPIPFRLLLSRPASLVLSAGPETVAASPPARESDSVPAFRETLCGLIRWADCAADPVPALLPGARLRS